MEGNLDNELAELEAEIDKEEKAQKEAEEKETQGIDLYPENIEEQYNNYEKMISLGVLEKEKSLCFQIIRYKKKKKLGYDLWEVKKKLINKKIDSITSLIKQKTWNYKTYKLKIQEELNWEENNFNMINKDPNLNKSQKQILKDRIKDRIDIIKEEMNKEIKDETEDNIDINIGIDVNNMELFNLENEKKYFDVEKTVCLGVLEKEKELCDKIIAYKKEKLLEYKQWETKKNEINKKMESITSLVQNEIWNLDIYKEKLDEELKWEEENLLSIEIDINLDEKEKNLIIERIKRRKKIIETEISRNPEEEEDN